MFDSIEDIKKFIDLLVTYGSTFVIFCLLLASAITVGYYWLKRYIGRLQEEDITRARKIVRTLDQKEIEDSHNKARSVQTFLEKSSQEIFSQGIDRVTVWINHNGTRSGVFHFLFYSLVAEAINAGCGVPSFGTSRIKPHSLPYYVFAEYEREISEKGYIFKHASQLSNATANLARDFGTKTVYGLPIISPTRGKLDGIILFESCSGELEGRPSVAHISATVTSLLSPLV